jgi:mannitol-specific phosphotransferase system IIBC component
MSNKKNAADSYILTFYKDVELLNHHYSVYKNVLTELDYTTETDPQNEDSKQLSAEHKKAYLEALQSLRYYIIQTELKIQSLKLSLSLADSDIKEINDTFKVIDTKDSLAISQSAARAYIIAVNTFLTNQVIDTLLSNVSDEVDKLYNDK